MHAVAAFHAASPPTPPRTQYSLLVNLKSFPVMRSQMDFATWIAPLELAAGGTSSGVSADMMAAARAIGPGRISTTHSSYINELRTLLLNYNDLALELSSKFNGRWINAIEGMITDVPPSPPPRMPRTQPYHVRTRGCQSNPAPSAHTHTQPP